MKQVRIKVSCRRDYLAVFPIEDAQYKALKRKLKKDGCINVDEVCEKLGKTTPLSKEKAIEYGLIVSECDPQICVDVDGEVVFEDIVAIESVTSDPFAFSFVNVDERLSGAFLSEMQADEFEADADDDYSISNYLTNNLERVKIEDTVGKADDGQKVLASYYGGYEGNGTCYYNFEMDDDKPFEIEKLRFFRACIEDQCDGIQCSATAEGCDIYLEDMILYENKVVGISDVDVEDYGDTEAALGEYYPGDCINFE